MADKAKETKEAPEAGATGGGGGGGIMAYLPLILTFTLMPVLAYAMTMFVLVPKMQKALGGAPVEAREGGSSGHGNKPAASHGSESSGGHGAKSSGKEAAGKGRIKVALPKMVGNVSGSMGQRLLLVSLTLTGSAGDFKQRIEEETDQLRDLASTLLSAKTIVDLEKPEARNVIRAELLTQFSTVLGPGYVQDIYITEFAIQ